MLIRRRADRGVSSGRSRVALGSHSVWLILALLGLGGCVPATIHPAGDAPPRSGAAALRHAVVPHFTGHFFVTTDGVRLPLRRWLPQGKIKAVILALHGFNDYSHAFAGPGAAWARDGIATYAYDQRGFGAAPGHGRWPGRAALAIDAAAACGVLHRLYPHVPLYLLGESMGGAVAIVTMAGEGGAPIPDIRGMILVAPAVWGRSTMGLLPRLALAVAVRLAPRLTLTGQGLHILASNNIPMLRALARDPLVIKATRVDTIYGLVNLMDAALASAPRLHVPLLLLYGAHDEVIPKLPIRRFVHALPNDPADPHSLAYYPQGYHMLLRDLDSRTVIADIAGWIFNPRAPLLSGADRDATAAIWGDAHAARLGGS